MTHVARMVASGKLTHVLRHGLRHGSQTAARIAMMAIGSLRGRLCRRPFRQPLGYGARDVLFEVTGVFLSDDHWVTVAHDMEEAGR